VFLLAMLSNLGINVTTFVASLGIGGIAVALAVQTILSDLFASLSIAVDKPFEVGHFIIFGDVLGTVTYVGLKTTRIQALSGQQIVVSNAELLKQTINNYKFMSQRRVVFGFGVSYATTPDQAEAIPALVRRAIESQDKTRFDRAHLLKFDENALQYEVVYYILDGDYNVYMDRHQAINLTIMRGLAEMGVSFAWPRRAVQMLDAPNGAHPWSAAVQAPASPTRQ
jgi:small-conductance mechanosensitive channel